MIEETTLTFKLDTILCIWCKKPVSKSLGLDYHIDCELEVLTYIPEFATLQQIEIQQFTTETMHFDTRGINHRETNFYDWDWSGNDDNSYFSPNITDFEPAINSERYYELTFRTTCAPFTIKMPFGKSNCLYRINMTFGHPTYTQESNRFKKDRKKYGSLPMYLIKEPKRKNKLQRRY